MSLPTVGRISYTATPGTFIFPTETRTVGASITPELDEARRTVVARRVSLTLESKIVSTTLDSVIEAATEILTHQGGTFRYTGRGALPLLVNLGGFNDVRWGPVPESLDFKPLGGGNGTVLTWRVAVTIAPCFDGNSSGVMEYTFGLNYDIVANGNTRRGYTARLVIASGRAGADGRQITDTADHYREQVFPALVPGFRRVPGTYGLSPDKCTLDVSVTDEQMGANIPPPGMFDAQADHTLSSVPGKWYTWNGVINATYELAKNGITTAGDAREAFFRLCRDRIGDTIAKLDADPGGTAASAPLPGAGSLGGLVGTTGTNKSTRPCVIPVSFTMSDPEIYTAGGQKVKFSLAYQVCGADLRRMLSASGLWRPAPDSDWKRWVYYLGNVADSRGTAQLLMKVEDDTIYDLCARKLVESDLRSVSPTDLNSLPSTTSIPTGVFPEPTPAGSWVHYANAVHIDVDDNVTPVVTLPAKKADPLVGMLSGQPLGGLNAVLWNLTDASMPKADGGPDLAKQDPTAVSRKRPSGWITLRGEALRVRYGIQCPELLDYGGVKPVPANRPDRGEGFWSGVVGNAGWPVTYARWNLRFFIAEMPQDTQFGTLPNPVIGSM